MELEKKKDDMYVYEKWKNEGENEDRSTRNDNE